MKAEDSPTKEELRKYGEPRRFILTRYHFGGFYPKRVWDINDIAKLMQQYHKSQLQALKDPKKIREIMKGSDFEHLKIEDEFGFTGEWRMSEKGVLDVIINLITNLEDNE